MNVKNRILNCLCVPLFEPCIENVCLCYCVVGHDSTFKGHIKEAEEGIIDRGLNIKTIV